MNYLTACTLFTGVAICSFAWAEVPDDVLFSFQKEDAAAQWQSVNDGVMGGRSDGRFAIQDQRLRFYGTLSLENNGGFASVRSRSRKLNLVAGDVIVARVRGDGREYSFNLYQPGRRTAFSYRTTFKTKQDAWIEVQLPLDQFVATWFGRTLPDQKLNPAGISGVGILLGDKRPGAFQLEVDWIKRLPAGS